MPAEAANPLSIVGFIYSYRSSINPLCVTLMVQRLFRRPRRGTPVKLSVLPASAMLGFGVETLKRRMICQTSTPPCRPFTKSYSKCTALTVFLFLEAGRIHSPSFKVAFLDYTSSRIAEVDAPIGLFLTLLLYGP